MTNKPEVAKVRLYVSYGDEAPIHFCPRCGKQILTADSVEPCPHLWYFYSDIADGFVYVDESLGEPEYSFTDDDEEEMDSTRIMRERVQAACERTDAVVETTIEFGGGGSPVTWVNICCIDYMK